MSDKNTKKAILTSTKSVFSALACVLHTALRVHLRAPGAWPLNSSAFSLRSHLSRQCAQASASRRRPHTLEVQSFPTCLLLSAAAPVDESLIGLSPGQDHLCGAFSFALNPSFGQVYTPVSLELFWSNWQKKMNDCGLSSVVFCEL